MLVMGFSTPMARNKVITAEQRGGHGGEQVTDAADGNADHKHGEILQIHIVAGDGAAGQGDHIPAAIGDGSLLGADLLIQPTGQIAAQQAQHGGHSHGSHGLGGAQPAMIRRGIRRLMQATLQMMKMPKPRPMSQTLLVQQQGLGVPGGLVSLHLTPVVLQLFPGDGAVVRGAAHLSGVSRITM